MLEFLEYNYQTNPIFFYYILTFVIIIGLIFGSFINVVGLRLLSGESIVLPPSKCPKCGTKLKWYDNIPVLAYLLLKGKCRYCKTPISIQYPIIEAANAIMFLLIFLKYDFSLTTLFLWVLVGACIAMCITDFKEQIIFDAVSIPLIPIGLIFSFFNIGNYSTEQISIFNFQLSSVFISSIIGIAIAFLFFETISLFSKLLIKQRAFGEGDTIIAMIFGAFFGWTAVITIIILAFLVQAAITLPLMFTKILKLKDKTALISFCLLCGSVVLPIAFEKLNILNTTAGSTFVIFATLGIAIGSALTFLRRMKELNAFSFLPFGPALILAGFVVLLWGEHFNLFNILL